MKRQILICTVLVTNIAFGAPLPSDVRDTTDIGTNKNKLNTLSARASAHLHAKGLDEEVAKQKVFKILEGDEHINSLMAHNITTHFEDIKHDDIVAHVSENALYEKSVNFSSYEDILALVQKNSRQQLDKAALAKIEKVSLENQNLQAMSA